MLSDSLGDSHAAALTARLLSFGLQVERVEQPTFPIACSPPSFLLQLASRARVCIAVISEHPHAAWVANELLGQTILHPGWLVALAAGVSPPRRFELGDPRIIASDEEPMARVAAAIAASAVPLNG